MIALVRVDNRLLHGQVLETWLPRLGVRGVVVADDEAAASALARAAMTLCVPPGAAGADRAGRVASTGPRSRPRRGRCSCSSATSPQLAQAHAAGLTPALAPRLNVGNVHFGPGRRAVTPSVFLSEDELRTLRELASAGFEVELRAVPAEAPAGIDEIERRYAAAR